MTAIAAFEVHGKAAIIADMLLSKDDGRGAWPSLPTNPDASLEIGTATSTSFGGLVRKLLLVNPLFAVAWAGSKFWAESLMRVAVTRFKDQPPSKEQIISALKSVGVPVGDMHHTIIVGWVLGTDRFCFSWSSTSPDTLSLNVQHVAGTGERFLNDALTRGYVSYDRFSKDHAGKAVAASVAKVVCRELEEGDTLEELFGFAYDMVVETDGKFSYLPSVLFFFWEMEINEVGDIVSIGLFQRVLKWMNYGTLAAVQVVQLNRPQSEPSRLEDVATEDEVNTLVEPTHYNGPFPSEPPKNESAFNAEWFAIVCQITCGRRVMLQTLVYPTDNVDGPFAVIRDGESYRFDVRNTSLKALARPLWLPVVRLRLWQSKRFGWEFVIGVPWWARARRALRRFYARARCD